MRTWAPDSESSRVDRTALVQFTRSSLLEVVELVAPTRQELISALREAPEALIFHPDFFDWYFEIRDRVGEDDEEGVIRQLDRIEGVFASVRRSQARAESHRQVLSVALDLGGVTETASVSRAAETARDMGGSGTHFRLVQDSSPETRVHVAAALSLLQDLWPEAHEELAVTVQQLALFEDDALESFADFRRHGSIFIHAGFLKNPVLLAEFLVHEGGHVRLNTVLSIRPMFLNPSDARYSTPLRKDPRPMFGAFHQMFVLCRILEFYRRLSRRRTGYEAKVEEVRTKLQSGWELVREHAQLTEPGEGVVSSIEQTLRA
jgi:HEXXH motif-containing protein